MDVPPPPPPAIPCLACNFLWRKCEVECIFAPYFPGDQLQKFAIVHRIYGASNVAKILTGINVAHCEDPANSLAYEAEARLRDPVFGVIGFITVLHHRLNNARARLNNGGQGANNNPIPQLPPGAILPRPPTPVPNPHAANAGQQPQLRPFYFENIPLPEHPQQQMLDLNEFDYMGVGVGDPFGPMANPDMMERYNNQLPRAGTVFNRCGGGDHGASSSTAEAGGSSGAAPGGSNTSINLDLQLMELGEPAVAPRDDAPLDYQLETQLKLKSPINDEDN